MDSSHTNIEICPGKLTIWNTTFYQSVESQMVLIVGGQSKEMVALNGICNSKQYEILKFVTASLFWIILEHILLLFYCFLLKEQPLVS